MPLHTCSQPSKIPNYKLLPYASPKDLIECIYQKQSITLFHLSTLSTRAPSATSILKNDHPPPRPWTYCLRFQH